MKLLSYILLLALPIMCSKSPSVEDQSKNYAESETLHLFDDTNSETVNGLISVPSETYSQKVIKESYLRFETKDLNKTYLQIKKAVSENKGYIQDDKSSKSYNTLTRHLVIRIPSINFQKTIDTISQNVSYFDTKHISLKDVTEEFIDLEARLKAKQTLEKRYLELLSKAKNVKEILEIEKELSTIREEVEAKQGRLKYLQNRVSLSTLDIEFYKLTSEQPITTSYGTKMWNAIKSGFNGLSMFFLGLLYVWPFIIILIIAIFLIRRWVKKTKK